MQTYQEVIIPTSRSLQLFADRFWAKVEQRAIGCWIWTAALGNDPRGGKRNSYGQFWVGSKADGTGRMAFAHRVAWELSTGPIPEGMKVLHHCDNPACVRPSHLFLGTQVHNMIDMVAKGRANRPTGIRHYCAKLTDDQVREIRKLYRPGKHCAERGNAIELAHQFGVTRGTIIDVATRSRKHIQ